MKVFDYLLPKPVTVIPQPGALRITPAFTVGLKGAPGKRTCAGVSRFLARLAGRTGLSFLNHKPLHEPLPETCSFVISNRRQGKLALGEDESYRLEIGPKQAVLQAETDLGVLRGLETILQLLTADQDGPFFPAVRITDQPRFPWRGLLIDCARHFQPVEVIKRNLDGMAAVKLNVLHWHLTDDQGFRVESKVFPRLHQEGAAVAYYTQEQIREVINYADLRGIRVVPEFDLPGHTSSWVLGYPELASAPGPHHPEIGFGVKDTLLNPAREETYTFLAAFFQEMAVLFPDEYIHIGGDENNGRQWLANPEIQAFMRAHGLPDTHALQTYFNRRLLAILTRLQKKMVGWDEILAAALPTSTVVIQAWRSKERLWQAAKMGYRGILSHGYYLDLMQPAAFHYQNDPLAPAEGAPADELTPEQQQLVLGGEAAMWTEFISPETIDARLWPRAAAIAERLWSPPAHCTPEHLDRRLARVSLHLEELGLTHEKNYPMMLRRLCGQWAIEPLQTLVDLCEPVKNYERAIQCPDATIYSPLTRVVDAAPTEAKAARRFHQLVRRYLSTLEQDPTVEASNTQAGENESLWREIKAQLTVWHKNHTALEPIIKSAPLLHEIRSLSAALARIAGLGLDILALWAKQQNNEPLTLDPTFFQQLKQALAAAAKPRGQVELVVVPAIAELVETLWQKLNAGPGRN